MERVGTLIHKLKDLFDQGAGSEQLAAAVHMLLAELETANPPMFEPEKPSKMGVSVVMPKGARIPKPDQLIQAKLPLDIPDDTSPITPIDIPTNKSIDIQKKKRSDIISSINNKYCILVNRKDIFLIYRIRVENDRRVYEYFISPDQIIEVEKYLI